ncbi:MAG: DUF6328 family protein [Acidimicrobiales bacterium]
MEDENERLNREFDQLLGGLRVALPGVQVLLAFLLTMAFSARADELDHDGRVVYLLSVVLASLATVALIAPTFHHRVRFREGTKEQMIHTANVLVLAGAVCLATAIGCALYVVGDTLYADSPARWLGPGVVVVAGLTWFALPLTYRSGQTPRPGGRRPGS